MIVNKSTCGMCKPHKKWKRNRTKLRNILTNALTGDELSLSLIRSYQKKFDHDY